MVRIAASRSLVLRSGSLRSAISRSCELVRRRLPSLPRAVRMSDEIVVLFYRELGFALEQVRTLRGDPDFDRGEALRERKLLEAEVHRLERMIRTIDDAIDAHERGETMSDETMFAVFGEEQRDLQRQAEERWDDTDAWTQSRQRTAHYTRQDWQDLKAKSEHIMERIAEAVRHSAGQPARDGRGRGAPPPHHRAVLRLLARDARQPGRDVRPRPPFHRDLRGRRARTGRMGARRHHGERPTGRPVKEGRPVAS